MKQKKNDYWFKRRRYGYGWTPVTREGWLVVFGFLAVLMMTSYVMLKDVPENTFNEDVVLFLCFLIIEIAAIIVVGYLKGPKPRWRWGKKKGDKPSEDI